MVGLDSSSPVDDGGAALTGAAPQAAGTLSGPMAALLAALGKGAQGKSGLAPKAGFSLPSPQAGSSSAQGKSSGKKEGGRAALGTTLGATPPEPQAALPAPLPDLQLSIPTLDQPLPPPEANLPATAPSDEEQSAPAASAAGVGGMPFARGQAMLAGYYAAGSQALAVPAADRPIPQAQSPVGAALGISAQPGATGAPGLGAAANAAIASLATPAEAGASIPAGAGQTAPAPGAVTLRQAPLFAPSAGPRGQARPDPVQGGEGRKGPPTPDAPADVAAAAAPPGLTPAKASTPTAETGPAAPAPAGGEKFAAFSAGTGNGDASPNYKPNKNSLDTENKDDGKQTTGVGTGTAQSTPVMPSSRSNSSASSTGEVRAFLSPPSQAGASVPSASAALAGPAASTAHRAVESIARIAEAQAGRAGNADAVSFGFKMGDQNLTVRVEMRGGEVRTQFSTDSSELRSAIAGEWSTLANGSGERSYQFSAPVFTTSDGRPADAGADTGSPQRETPGQFSSGSGQFSAFATADDATEAAPAAFASAPVTAQHLHTFA